MVPCAGHGMCVEASFQDGRCADDLSDEVADPLNEPFVPVASAAQTPGSFSFNLRPNATLGPGEDQRSVIAVNGRSYFLSPGQVLVIPTLTLSFYTCDSFLPRNPLQVTYECTDVIAPPQPAWTQVCAFGIKGRTRTLSSSSLAGRGAMGLWPVFSGVITPGLILVIMDTPPPESPHGGIREDSRSNTD